MYVNRNYLPNETVPKTLSKKKLEKGKKETEILGKQRIFFEMVIITGHLP